MTLETPLPPLGAAVLKGWRRRCPKCGQGRLFPGYLTVAERCPVCDERTGLHRADDGPAYLTILIVGHVMAPLLLFVFLTFNPEPAVLATIFCIFTLVLSLYLLPRLKGVIVAFQWARGLADFHAPGMAEPPNLP